MLKAGYLRKLLEPIMAAWKIDKRQSDFFQAFMI